MTTVVLIAFAAVLHFAAHVLTAYGAALFEADRDLNRGRAAGLSIAALALSALGIAVAVLA